MRHVVALSCLLAATSSAARGPVSDVLGRPVLDAAGRRVLHHGAEDLDARSRGLSPAAPAAAPAAAPKAFDPLRMRDDATIGNFAQGLGVGGIVVADVDGDALPEIVVGHTAMWYVLELDPRTGGWRQKHFHEAGAGGTFGGGNVADVRVADLEADGTPEVIVRLSGGSIESWHAELGVLLDVMPLGAAGPADMEVVDVEGGPEPEILVVGTGGLSVYTWGVAAPAWTVAGVTGVDLAVGNVDGDPALEIVIANGASAGQVIDAATRGTEWAYSTGFGHFIDVADVDGDGRDEIAGCFDWDDCLVVDGDTRLEKWSFDNFDSSAVHCRDVTGDGIAEVGIGDGQWGDVHFRSGLDGTLVAGIPNPEHSVSAIAWGDVDGDCEDEVIWGAGYSSTGEDHLYVADLFADDIEWENLEYDGPMHAFAIGDVDADGRTEIVRACSESEAGYDGALVYVTDLHHRLDEWEPTATTNDGWMRTQGMELLQADADAALEYAMNASTTYSGKVAAFDGVTHARQWLSAIFDGEYVNALGLGDVEGDGDLEVLVGTGRAHSGALGTFLRILASADGAVEYRSPDYGGAVGDIRVADVDGDGSNEIAVVTTSGVRLLDGTTRVEEWLRPGADVTALDVADTPPVGSPGTELEFAL